mgnify:CR=1 FL=1
MTRENRSIESRLGHTFGDPELLRRALTHASREPEAANNERLEFLGDSVLGLAIAEALYRGHPDATEGELDHMRAALVNGKTLAQKGGALGLGDLLRTGSGYRAAPSNAMLEDAFEALAGAIYLDGGWDAAASFVRESFRDELKAAAPDARRNAKGRLQEWSQGNRNGMLPEYAILSEAGPGHSRAFTAAVYLDGEEIARGTGTSKKAAEAEAAAAALEKLDA